MHQLVHYMSVWNWLETMTAIAGIGYGAFSAAQPKRSIQLYQGMMEKANWRVSPIDEVHEIRMTRALGILLVLICASVLIFLPRGIF